MDDELRESLLVESEERERRELFIEEILQELVHVFAEKQNDEEKVATYLCGCWTKGERVSPLDILEVEGVEFEERSKREGY